MSGAALPFPATLPLVAISVVVVVSVLAAFDGAHVVAVDPATHHSFYLVRAR